MVERDGQFFFLVTDDRSNSFGLFTGPIELSYLHTERECKFLAKDLEPALGKDPSYRRTM